MNSIYNYFYPPQDSQETVYSPQKSREVDFPHQVSQEDITQREKASKIEEVQNKLSNLVNFGYDVSSLKLYMLDEKEFILENLSRFKNQFFEIYTFYSYCWHSECLGRREYIHFLVSEGFIQADDYRIIAYSVNFTSSQKLELIEFILNKKEESTSFKLETLWCQHIEEVFIQILEKTNFSFRYSTYEGEEKLSKVIELLKSFRNKAGSLEKFFGPYSVFPKRFTTLINQLVSSDGVRNSLWWGDTFSVLYYPVLSFALDSGIEITPDNAMKLFSYRNSISSSSPNILALYEELTDKYLSKQGSKSLEKLALDASRQPNLYFFKKIIQCDRLNKGMVGEGEPCFYDDLFENILNEYQPYVSYEFLKALFESLNSSTLASTQYDRLIDIVVDGVVMSLENEYDYYTDRKARDICKLLNINVIHDFDQLKRLCFSVEEKLGKRLASRRDKRRVGNCIVELFYEHLPAVSPFKIDRNAQENSLDNFFNHPLIQEIQRFDKSPKSLSVYRLSLIALLLRENTTGLAHFMSESLSGDVSKGEEISKSKVKVIEFMEALAKLAQPICFSEYYSDFISRLMSKLMDEEFFTVEEMGSILVNLKNPLLYLHYIKYLSDQIHERLINKLPTDSTYSEVKKQLEIVLTQYDIDFGLVAKAHSLFEGYPMKISSSYKGAKDYALNEIVESIYECLVCKRNEKEDRELSSIEYTFSEMLSFLEEDRYERLCQFLERKTYSYPPFDLNHSEGEQLLFKAIEKTNILVVKQLVEVGYDLDKTYDQKLTAIEYAKEQGRSSWFINYLESCTAKSE